MTLYEWYNVNDDAELWEIPDYEPIQYSVGQTFTVGNTGTNENFDLTSIKSKQFSYSGINKLGTVTFHLRATAAGLPTGGDLSTGTIDGDLWNNTATWYEVNMSTYGLTASTKYCILFSTETGTWSADRLGVRADITSPTYSGGSLIESLVTANTARDIMFEIYGSAAGGGATATVQLNIGDAWKDASGAMTINIGDAWKPVSGLQVNIGDAWKTVF